MATAVSIAGAATITPLTTAYSAPAYCGLSGFVGWYVLPSSIPGTIDINNASPSCLVSLIGTQPIEQFSPGVCPAGWTPGPTTTINSATTVQCCPFGTATGISDAYCTTSITSPVTFYVPDNTAETTIVSRGVLRNPFGITITYQEEDLASFTPASAPLQMRSGQAFMPISTSTSTSSSTSSTRSTSTSSTGTGTGSTPNSSSSPSNPTTVTVSPVPPSFTTSQTSGGGGGLSVGAQAGVGVGASAGGLLALTAIGFFLFRRRRSKHSEGRELESTSGYGYDNQPTLAEMESPKFQTTTGQGFGSPETSELEAHVR